jgi:hypothetical protein
LNNRSDRARGTAGTGPLERIGGGLLLADGTIAGLIGAATIALWFLVVDTLRGRPLYTPSLLGTALFRGREALAPPETHAISLLMVLLFTLAHGLIFVLIGQIAARLVRLAEKNANYGFGIILFFVFFLSGFFFVSMVFAAELLHALTWPAVLAGNLFAVAAMTMYFARRHPGFRMLP